MARANADVTVIADGFRLSQRGPFFVRNICAAFDARLPGKIAHRRHAMAVQLPCPPGMPRRGLRPRADNHFLIFGLSFSGK
jgi:hypothetical protein